ncbi:MAG: enoyl-CoA hydratase-related protein [Myxococcales bacterium]|nr:enoyl-CoA hydratase-related protein [Myxococcales bacterium]MDH3483461.1 enoyl-CoA hydratase-related protein [Myxococcales bacterium]
MTEMKHIRVERRGPVGILTIARRERLNSLDVETAQDFRKAGLRLARDKEVRSVLICGEGGVFCSGADLKYIRDGGDDTDLGYLQPSTCQPTEGYGEIFKQILEYIHSTISEIRRAPKPFIAAVDGPAAAGGFGIAMSCDLVVASERAWFEWAYFKTGLTGAESSTFFLPRLLGLRKALELVLLNPRLSARDALEWGLINRVFPDDSFGEKALEIATQLAEAPTSAVAAAKNLLNQAAGMDRLDVHLDAELTELARIADGPNFAEGIAAFFEKRAPRFESEG